MFKLAGVARIKFMKKIVLLSLFGCLLASALKAQNTPAFDGRQMIDVAKVSAWNFASRPAGWYRIAKTSMRGNATFELREDANHATLRFEIGISYNYNGGSSLTITSHSTYTATVFTKLRLLTQSVYGDAYLEVYVDPHNNDNSIFNAYMINPMANGDWSLLNWETGSVPMGYSVVEFEADQLFLVGNAVKGSIFSISRNGNVGIGTSYPSTALEIFKGSVNEPALTLNSSSSGWGSGLLLKNTSAKTFGIYSGSDSKLHFSDESVQLDRMVILGNGYMGVGTTVPTEKLSVYGTLNSAPGVISLESSRNDAMNVEVGAIKAKNNDGEIARIGMLRGTGTYTGSLNFSVRPTNEGALTEAMRIAENGNVLIGKIAQANTAYKFDVNGKVRANEIVVNTTGADFVFEDQYKLKPLAELEQFIKQYKHLPEIPTAQAMQKEGVGVSELQTKLLQKIEELTLHLIEKDKELNKEKEINKGQNERLKEVEAKQHELEALLKKLVANK